MEIIDINMENIENNHICCAIGNDKLNQKRENTKKDWMKENFDNGLKFKRLDERGKVFIEYMPIETVWKPVIGENYMMINCLWVSGKFKGKGFSVKLLDECIKDSKNQNKDGIAVVCGNKTKPFLTDKKFYLKQGFEVVDYAEPYFELLVLKFNEKAQNPKFSDKAKKGIFENKADFSFVYSNQCTFMEDIIYDLGNFLKSQNKQFEIIKLNNFEEAKEKGSPFGTFGLYYKGKFVTHRIMKEKDFEKEIYKLV